MTEYEAASLAVQQSALALHQAAIWVAAAVGAAQCAVVGHGLFALHRYYKRSAEQHRTNMEALDSRHQETMASLESRHRETMKALEDQNNAIMELIRRTSA